MHVVCIIDDDSSVRKAVANLLKSEGYQPVCFQSGESFLGSPWKNQAACLILDLCMADMQGHDVQRSLNALEYRVPVICMSAQATEQAITASLQAGAVQFIAKPFTAEVLLAAIARAVKDCP